MRLMKTHFDFFYMIICSRGPGSETLTLIQIPPRQITGFVDDAAKQLTHSDNNVTEAESEFNEEGPILAVRKGDKLPLASIYKWLVNDNKKWDEEFDDDKELKKMFADNKQAFLSAELRLFVADKIEPMEKRGEEGAITRSKWTSCNGWRKVSIELPNKQQFELLMEATGQTADELGKWKCAVMKKAAKLYKQGKLPLKPYGGC